MSNSFGGISRWSQMPLEKPGMILQQCCFKKNMWTAVVNDFECLAAEKIFSNTWHGMAKSAGF